jgi:ribonuclease VapC
MVIDTSAVIAVVFDEDERNAFTEAIAANSELLISAASVFESCVVAAAKKSNPMAAGLVDHMIADLQIQVVPFDSAAVTAAREAYFRFGKGNHPARLNLGDCFAYALAKSRGLPLLFKGDDFARTDIVPAWRP